MVLRIYVISCLCLCAASASTLNAEQLPDTAPLRLGYFETYGKKDAYKGDFSPSNLPDYKDYAVLDIYKGKRSIKLNSYPGAQKYRTRLREGVESGALFAGHYAIVEIGDGLDNENLWIIDVKTGEILDCLRVSRIGAIYRPDSRLLIVHTPILCYDSETEERDVEPKLGTEKYRITHSAGHPLVSMYLSVEEGSPHKKPHLKLIYQDRTSNILERNAPEVYLMEKESTPQ